MPDEAPTIATVLKSMGYATGQFGKNHLGDLNQFLPTVHGFDEFFGYLYHLDAMEDPCHPNYRLRRRIQWVRDICSIRGQRMWMTPRSNRVGDKIGETEDRGRGRSCVRNA